jgi:hypothetical protein
MLNTFATRLESDHGPKDAVKAIRLFAKDRTIRHAERRDGETNEKRTERQRTLFNALPSSNAADRLKEAMLQQAYDLLWDGDCFGCDALLEFIPSKDADALLNAWSSDQGGEEPKSKWYPLKVIGV